MKRIYLVFVGIAFIVSHLVLSSLAPHILPQAFFPYLDDLQKSGLPQYIYSLANFDGTIYLKIAKSGYLPLTHAFFPLYPITIATFSFILKPILAGVMISLVSFMAVLIVFSKYLDTLKIEKSNQLWVVAALLSFPTSFYLLGVYTESLFLLLLVGALFSMRKKVYILTFLLSMLAALTRFVGIFLVIPIFFEILSIYKFSSFSFKEIWEKLKKNHMPIIPLFGAPIGFLMYSVFLWRTTGDPIRFFNNLPDFQTGRQTDLILFPQVMFRYLKIFLTAQLNFQYVIAIVEFVTFTGVFVVLTYELWKIYKKEYKNLSVRLGLNLFSFANLLLPTFTGTFTSLPRYVLTSLSLFIVLGEIKSRKIQLSLFFLFSILHIILFLLFIRGYFVS